MGIGEGMDKCAHACAPRGLVVPMDWNEDPAWDLRGGDVDTQHGTPVRRANPGEPVSGEAELRCIVRVHLDEGIEQVTSEFRREAGAGHRVPLVAYPPGVQKEGKVRVQKAPVREHSLFPACTADGGRPLQRRERIVIGVA